MLQNNYAQTPMNFEHHDSGLDPRQYLQLLKRRLWYVVIPFVLVSAIGAVVALTQPAIYRSEGKILIESQAIPVELVRPTVSATAAARIQVIEQRVMTRENLLAIVNKFQVFAKDKANLSGTEILDKMRARARITPFELDLPKLRSATTVAFSVSFDDENPDIAQKVANELMTLILGEDARTRTNRAQETTKFLEREAKRLEGELAAAEAKVAEIKRQNKNAVPESVLNQLATMRSELQLKSAVYAESHPEMRAIQKRVASLEQIVAQSAQIDAGLETLERQKKSIERNLEDTSQKLAVARRGELLERDQKSERLEVIEQPVMPGTPLKGTRLKLIVAFLGAAVAAGAGAVFAAETLDRTIRNTSDLARIVDPHLIVGIPYITTEAETLRARRMALWSAQVAVVLVVAGLISVHFLWMPLDLLWAKVLLRIQS